MALLKTYVETWLNKAIFKDREDLTKIVLSVYEQHPSEQNYIEMCIEQYTTGKASAYEVRRWLEKNVIKPFNYVKKQERKFANETKNIL